MKMSAVNIFLFTPIIASVFLIFFDYFVVPKITTETVVQVSHIYAYKRGSPCRLSIHVPSKWGNVARHA